MPATTYCKGILFVLMKHTNCLEFTSSIMRCWPPWGKGTWRSWGTCCKQYNCLIPIIVQILILMLWFEYVPQRLCVGNLTPNAAVLRGGAYKTWLGHEGSAFMNTLMPLLWGWVPYEMKSLAQFPFSLTHVMPSTMLWRSKKVVIRYDSSILEFLASGIVRQIYFCSL